MRMTVSIIRSLVFSNFTFPSSLCLPGISIGFEIGSYSFPEEQETRMIRLVKESNIISELTLQAEVTLVTLNEENLATLNEDFLLTVPFTVTFRPDQQFVDFPLNIVDDNIVEPDEHFQLMVQIVSTKIVVFRPSEMPTTNITILNDDGRLESVSVI